MSRTYQLQNVGLEIFFQQRSSLYLTFSTRQVRNSGEPAQFRLQLHSAFIASCEHAALGVAQSGLHGSALLSGYSPPVA